MSGVQRNVGHPAAAAIHINTASLHWAEAVQRLGAAKPIDAAYHAQIACDNLVFAIHHAAEGERTTSAPPPGDVDPAHGSDPRRMS